MKKAVLIAVFAISNIISKDINQDFVIAKIGDEQITYGDFEKELTKRFDLERDYQEFQQFFPNFKALAFKVFINNIIIAKWAEENKIKTKKFMEEVEDACKNAPDNFKSDIDCKDIESGIILKRLLTDVKNQIDESDAAAKDFYNKNQLKNSVFHNQPFIKSLGGLKVQAVKFNTKNEAEIFLDKAKRSGNFLELAKREEKEVDDFQNKPINIKTPNVNLLFKFQLKRIKEIPTIKLTRIGKQYLVVNAHERVLPEFKPYEQVKNDVKKIMSQIKMPELLNKKLDELKEHYKVDDSVGKKLFGE